MHDSAVAVAVAVANRLKMTRSLRLQRAGQMDRVFFSILHIFIWSGISALFTVEVESPLYEGQFQHDVKMVCRYPPGNGDPTVIWRRIRPSPEMEVFRLQNGREDDRFQDKWFRGRVQLVKEDLRVGRAALLLSDLNINDTGVYQCLIETGEADVAQTSLTVKAAYTAIKRSVRSVGDGLFQLSCESHGYPNATVAWKEEKSDKRSITLRSDTTAVAAADHRFNVTSSVVVKRAADASYTCTFLQHALPNPSATFTGADLPSRSSVLSASVVASLIAIVAIISAAAFLYWKLKGAKVKKLQSPRILTADKVCDPSFACLPTQEFSLYDEVFKDKMEMLRVALKKHYTNSFRDKTAEHGFFPEEVFSHLFHTRDGQPVDPCQVLPASGETVVLEGNPGGKTFIAQHLALSWAQDRNWHLFTAHFQLVVLVACEQAKGNLLQQVISDLTVDTGLAAEDLLILLMETADSLLILDGYTEGCEETDEWLHSFMRNSPKCGLLITACQGQCQNLERRSEKVMFLHKNLHR
uniref:Ig-like domain-containing protein n=1 Tax=Denticeps clupeoides TaxID=299321 RepID=A0AAY4DVV2_9TELE